MVVLGGGRLYLVGEVRLVCVRETEIEGERASERVCVPCPPRVRDNGLRQIGQRFGELLLV